MTNKRNLCEGFSFLLQCDRQRLIHGVLKGLYMRPSDGQYDDYFQDACLIFAKTYVDFDGDPTQDTENFMHYAYQRIRWRLLDQIRRAHWQDDNNEMSLDDPILSETQREVLFLDPHSSSPMERATSRDFVNQLLTSGCPAKQRQYLHAVLDLGLNDSEIARYYGVSRQTVYAWRKGVIRRARLLMQ